MKNKNNEATKEQTIKLELTTQQINNIIIALSQQPYVNVVETINSIFAQVNPLSGENSVEAKA